MFVDIHGDGELLKETFDIEKIPAIRLVKGDKVFVLKWGGINGLWSASELREFVSTGYETALYDFKRKRVQEGLELYLEYSINTLADGSFNHAMENYMTVRKVIHEWTGYKHDLKSYNHNFGKKNAFKNSQMRTLLMYAVVPGIVITTTIGFILFSCLMTCIL